MSATSTVDPMTQAFLEPRPLVQLEHLDVTFPSDRGPVQILHDVNLSVGPGEVVGLVGESGSGKSVTCQTAAGLLENLGGTIRSGRVLIDGEDFTHASEGRWREVRGDRVGYVFQQPTRSLNPAFKVGDQIAETLRAKRGMGRRDAWTEAVRLMERVHIADAARRATDYPHMMSGGMCQRVAIAIAVAAKPRLLIADEPTTALDVTVQRQILDLLEELKSELGLGILYVTHDLDVVHDVCNRVLVFYAGQIVEEATTDALFERPRHPYAAGLMAATPQGRSKSRLGFIRGSVPRFGEPILGCHFADRCDHLVDACQEGPIALEPVGHGRVRCLRAGELDLRGHNG